ncbi:UDP-N-acetylmuramoyl-L-alanine--D-glutamate ligase [Brevibacterium sp. 5221]|uniref:UDP-N-acetylmuramoylalanine--D-glutamate ligase n=1 Tax=Brevibacterium rongguiense TaxID=2695267 RepID=A0A6N9HA08_9MICO|nr:UDP-N-acetylmuramoyl-L-alanine--D-glutamate ligase [Brevibacterium rongguiense]
MPEGATVAAYPHADRIPAAIHGPDSSLRGIVVCVTGLGVSGYPMAVHLAERGAEVIVVDADIAADRSEHEAILAVFDADIRRGPSHVEALPRTADGRLPDLVCTSQGWRPDQPLLVAAQAAGIPVIGEVELAWRVRGANSAPWLVVTGTNGKTTTTSMLASMLSAAGLEARACGNIGAPLLEAVLDPEAQVLAIELASFQLHWQFSMCADSAAVLNLAPDHLDWHGGLDAYAAAKAKAYHNVGLACVYSRADPATRTMVEDAEVRPGARAIGFGTEVPGPGDFGLVDDVLVDRAFLPERYSAALEIADTADVAIASGTPDRPAAPHQIANALAAAALARSIGVPPAAVRTGLRAHVAGGHRLALVATAGGAAYVDDSKATNPHAAAAALAAFEPIVWIAGGLAKGARYEDLVERFGARLRACVLIGAEPGPLAEALAARAPGVPVVRIDPAEPEGTEPRGADVMARAVAAAAQLARPGDTVLLAPAAASMDQFRDYAVRGDAFAAAAREVAGE